MRANAFAEVLFILGAGADINYCDDRGKTVTALMHACACKYGLDVYGSQGWRGWGCDPALLGANEENGAVLAGGTAQETPGRTAAA